MNPAKPAQNRGTPSMATKTRAERKTLWNQFCRVFAVPSRSGLKPALGLSAWNDRPVALIAACNVALDLPVQVDSPENEIWWRVAPLGEYRYQLPDGTAVMQVIDREACETMARTFDSFLRRLGLKTGLPIYEGHPDNPAWQKENPGVKPSAVGRIQAVEVRDDGLWGKIALNTTGRALLDPSAPAYLHHSPHWFMSPISGRAHAYRPVELRSLGLTNQPNLPRELTTVAANEETQPTTTMPEWLIKLLAPLGITPTSTQADIEAALTKLLTARTEATAAATTAAANTATLTSELAAARRSRAELVVGAAVATGRLPESDRAATIDRLAACNDTQFAAERTKLEALTPAANTAPTPNFGARRNETANYDRIAAINTAVSEHMKKTGCTRDVAWNAVKAEKPTLFA